MKEPEYQKKTTFFLSLYVFIGAICVTLLFWLFLSKGLHIYANESSDYTSFYEPVARNIILGRWFTIAGNPAIQYPCGYPLLLSGVFSIAHLYGFPEVVILKIFNLLCIGLAAVLIFLIARSIWGPKRALAAAFVWVTCPLILWLTKQPNSEIPFFVFFYGSFYLLWRSLLYKKRNWFIYFICGALIGFTMLIRPIAIGLGIVFCIIIWVMARYMTARLRFLVILALVLGNLTVILPWEAWVYRHTGKVIPLGAGSGFFMRDGLTFAVNPKNPRQGVELPKDVLSLMRDVQNNYPVSLYPGVAFLAKELRRRPSVVAKLFIIKAGRCWYGTNSNRFENINLLFQIPYFLLLAVSMLLAWRQGNIFRQLTISCILIMSYFWLMATLFLSIVRYMIPVIGLSFVLFPALFSLKKERLAALGRKQHGCPAIKDSKVGERKR